MNMNRATFNLQIGKYRKVSETSLKLARALSNAAILQFEEHGDLSYAQEFHDAMPKNYARRAAFLKWMRDFSPFKSEAGHFVKDKSETAKDFNTDGATTVDFWEHSPETELVLFGADNVVVALEKVVKAHTNTKKMRPISPSASEALEKVRNFITNLKEELQDNIRSNTPAEHTAAEPVTAEHTPEAAEAATGTNG